MSGTTRVVVTGVGLHTPFGDGRSTLAALDEGKSAVVETTLPRAPGFPPLLAAPAPPCDPAEFADRKLVKYMSPATALAVVAAGRALAHAGLAPRSAECGRASLFWATGLIAFELNEVSEAVIAARGADGELDFEKCGAGLARCHPLMPFRLLLNMPLGLISIALGVGGENFILYPSAYQAGVGLSTAVRGIAGGRFARALVGASAQLLSLMPVATLTRAAHLDLGRGGPGYPAADASACLVLESEQVAVERGAHILAEVGPPGLCWAPEQPSVARAGAAKVWTSSQAPDLLLSTGNLDEGREQASPELDGVRRVSCNRQLGYGGAASLPLAVALASLWLLRGAAPGRGQLASVLVASGEADGGHVAVPLYGGGR